MFADVQATQGADIQVSPLSIINWSADMQF